MFGPENLERFNALLCRFCMFLLSLFGAQLTERIIRFIRAIINSIMFETPCVLPARAWRVRVLFLARQSRTSRAAIRPHALSVRLAEPAMRLRPRGLVFLWWSLWLVRRFNIQNIPSNLDRYIDL